ncbi:MAG: hypothetical protein QHH06_09530 [Clostridiales bacterium]|jgi:CRP-like cAMP-binding protein|nr:cyclic nucleotide-binding domain-containing protein [Eubacteriales bacterium]MDH7566704.1 hypothetical protein [Clostridiales bacterium]
MNTNLYQNGNFSVNNGSSIFVEGQSVQSFNILLQGQIDVYLSVLDSCDGISEEDILKKSCKIYTLDQNTFWGASDFFLAKKHSVSYVAAEHCNVYAFPVHTLDQAKALFESQKDYGAYIVSSISSEINSSYSALAEIQRHSRSLCASTGRLGLFFWALKEKYGFSVSPSGEFFKKSLKSYQKLKENHILLPDGFNPDFFENPSPDVEEQAWNPSCEIDPVKIDYYKHILDLSMDLRKNFFGADAFITHYHCQEASKCLCDLHSALKEAFKKMDEGLNRLYSESGESIFSEFYRAAVEMKENGQDTSVISQLLDYMVHKLKELHALYENEYGRKVEIDIAPLIDACKQVESTPASSRNEGEAWASGIEVGEGSDYIPEELRNSVEKILNYSGISKDRADFFRSGLQAFKDRKDEASFDKEFTAIKNQVATTFFEIYEAVFKRATAEGNKSRLYHMFLIYGYMDEELLSARHIHTLYRNADKSETGTLAPVHNMREWLLKIYNKEKDPSVNEFGQDYFDTFREMKRRGEVTDKDKVNYDNNLEARLHYEISNMLKVGQKLCYGQMSTYFPILHNGMVSKDLSRAMVTPQLVNESVKKVLDADFSAFHREVFYRNPEKGIEKEFIMKAFPPDFILIPTFGSRSLMWQELTGRNRSTPGRLILPVFTAENLDDVIIRLIGNFRWELCRTMMGTYWNDISQKSLTSEYTDYIQFYKKNKDLSEEAKEKIKMQIQKYNYRMRDIFTSDYETWINHESKGIIRLNKVARRILYRYCPFPKAKRELLEKQPLFSDIAVHFNNIMAKQARQIENHYYKLTKAGISLDPDMEENLRFYKEM